MRKISKILASLLLIFVLLFNAAGCSLLPFDKGNTDKNNQSNADEVFYIDAELTVNMVIGDSLTLNLVKSDNLTGDVIWTSSSSCASVENGVVTAHAEGTVIIKAMLGNKVDRVIISIKSSQSDIEDEYIFGSEYQCITIIEALQIAESYTSSASTEVFYMVAKVDEISSLSKGEMTISDETGSIYVYKSTGLNGAGLTDSGLEVGDVLLISGTLRNYKGTLEIESGTVIAHYNPETEKPPRPGQGGSTDVTKPDMGDGVGEGETVFLPGTQDPITSDPYVGVNKTSFYATYTPAISYNDAYYRTQHNLMSGSIEEQNQKPSISTYQPKSNGKFVRNNLYIFSEDGNTYYVVDAYGEIAFEVYKGGAYVVLEEVAAYVFAFGEPPANHSASKSARPSSSPWGIYLRVNNTKFSGDTAKYPYEPELPRISGCGGDLTYYEMDVGTTGTDCDPDYDIRDYNDGYTITRGAARIVYSCKDRNGNKIIDLDERYLFYTYNHYNDFQEYLNYLGGWGEMFGNVTGGGTLSSKVNYNPTSYVPTTHSQIRSSVTISVIYYCVSKEEYAF